MPMLNYDEWARRQRLMQSCPALWATMPLHGQAAARGIVHGRRLPERECRTVRLFVATAEMAADLERSIVGQTRSSGASGSWWRVGAARPVTDATTRLTQGRLMDLGLATGPVWWRVYEDAVSEER